MLILGYIVSDRKDLSVKEDVVKFVNSVDECVLSLPKLIVGLENAKQYAIDNSLEFDILNRKFSNGDMWTFKIFERRQDYEKDILEYINYIKNILLKNINYYYINILKLKYNKIKDLYNIIINNKLNKNFNYYIIDKKMLYLSLNKTDVIGISLNDFNYIGIKDDKVISRIKQGLNNRIYYTSSKNMWSLKNKFNGIEYVIASLFSNNAYK